MSSGPELPRGTVTFLFTDIEGSTRLLKELRERYGEVLSEHQRILRDAFASHGGHEIDTQGDSFFVAFARAKDAVGAALVAQRALAAHSWPDGAQVRVRMGIHTGEPVMGGDRYVGLGVHRAARISAAGHGGQVLVSQTTRELLRDEPMPDVSLRDLGEHQLKDLDEPERIYQLVAPGLTETFPPLKTAAPAPFEGKEVELAEAAQEAVQKLRRPWWADRRLQIAAAVVAVLVVVPVVSLLAGGGGGGSARASGKVEANTVGVLDAKSGKLRTQIGVGEAPSGVAAGDGAIWVTNSDAGTVSRIDQQTNDVRQTIQVGGGPAGVAVSGDAVWVANGLDGTLSRIDPQTNQVVQTVTVGNGPSGVAFGEGSLWVANSADGTVSKVDPSSGRLVRTIAATVGATGVAAAFGRVWVVSPSSGTLVVLDPHSGAVEDRIGVGGDAAAVAAGAGAVWVANRADGTMSKIDPHARAVTSTIQVGRHPDAVAAEAGAVWVANEQDGTVSRVDPSSDAVSRTVSLKNPPQGLALTTDGLYVAVRSTGIEHRGGTLRLVTGEPDFIDPALAYAGTSWSTLVNTNDGLVGFRRVGGVEGAQLVPDLAVSLPVPTDAGRTYTFTLRAGIRYSTGRLVQPEDIRAELERVFAIAKSVSAARGQYDNIVGASACKPGRRCDLSRGILTNRLARSITFHLTAPDADFLAKLALPFASAVPAGTPIRDVGTRPVPATGPYMIVAYKKGKSLKIARNPRFREWSHDAQPEGYPDSIEWRFTALGDVTSGVHAVERGKADLAPTIVPPLSKRALDRLALHYPSQLHISTGSATWYFFLNTRVPPFDDVRVRQAVNYAFDRRAFAQLLGRAFAPTCQILPPGFPGYRRACPYGTGGLANLEKARTLVRKAGVAGATVSVWVPSPIAIQGRFMASLLDSLGFRARVKTVPPGFGPGTYFEKVLDSRVRAQSGYYGWNSDYPSAESFLREEFGCASFVREDPAQNGSPFEFCSHGIDSQMDRAAAVQAINPPAATLLWQRIEREILAQAPVVPTYNARIVDFVSKRVGNYQLHPQWYVLLDQLWVK
jgi:YVTN family beta-propeller protein